MALGSRTHEGTAGVDSLNGGDEFDDFMFGRQGDDTLSGVGRNDYLFGGHGDDQLFGGAGIDYLIGGPGADRLDGGESRDYADYSGNARAIVVTLSAGEGTAHGGAATGDTLFGIEAVLGSAFGDVLTGGRGRQVLDGRGGDDLLSGGIGDDELNGGDGNDRLAGGDGDGDFLFGGDGDDWITGGAGDDYLAGGNGVDLLDGGDGFDFYMVGYIGLDPVTIDLGNPARNTGQAADDTLVSIEGLQGAAGNETLIGDGADNTIYGGGGDDVLNGRGGNDTLIGGDQADRLYGGIGDDLLYGGARLLDGGAGDDVLGAYFSTWFTDGQRMRGGDGADVFCTSTNNTAPARILDFESGVDTLELGGVFSFPAGTPAGEGNLAIGTQAADADDYFVYDPATGQLWYDGDGSGEGHQWLMALLLNRPSIVAADLQTT